MIIKSDQLRCHRQETELTVPELSVKSSTFFAIAGKLLAFSSVDTLAYGLTPIRGILLRELADGCRRLDFAGLEFHAGLSEAATLPGEVTGCPSSGSIVV
jgi:hypothetical protein